MKVKEKVDMTKLARIERINYSKKLKVGKESFLREKKEKQELMINIKQMEEKQNALTDEVLALKKTLSLEVQKGEKLEEQAKLERNKVYTERHKRYDGNKNILLKLRDKDKEIVELTETLFDVSDEMLGMKKEKRLALKANRKMEFVLERTRGDLNKVEKRNEELREMLEEKTNIPYNENNNNPKELRKIKEGIGHGGTVTWPLWMVQLILESLVNGTPPSSVPANIISHVAIMNPEIKVKEVPSINFVRKCRTILRIVGETLAAYRLGKANDWQQLFSDGTSRRQSAIQNLIIGIKEDSKLRNIALSSSLILKGESSEEQFEAIAAMIARGGERLKRWADVCETKYPSYEHDIPKDICMNIGKLSRGGLITSDTCNAARKTRRIIVSKISEAATELRKEGVNVLEVDCWNHLRNVWLGGMTKALSSHLRGILLNDLDNIEKRLRVSTSIENILRAVDKEFSLAANYPKGHGELFRKWIETHHPGAVLLHVERTAGSRQDMCVEGAGTIYWNHKYWIEFLDQRLRYPGNNVLQENLFIILSSCEMLALARVCSIIHLSICIPIRWLAGNTHQLQEFDWSVRSMGKIVDILDIVLVQIVNDGSKIMDEEFMMGFFADIQNSIPPFKEYYKHMYNKKALKLLVPGDSKVIPLRILRDKLFCTTSKLNKQIVQITASLGKIAASALLAEIRDPKKSNIGTFVESC